MDAERQWFKSCIGLDVNETLRELAFFTHVVVSRQPMIASGHSVCGQPVITGGPRIRFQAGFPIFHKNGSCMGTLFLIDPRPRQFPESTVQLFKDLASVVEGELNAPPQTAKLAH